MEIATRESQLLLIMDYNNGCKKKIELYKMYTGYMKTPVLRFKNVNFIKPDGTIDQDRSYGCKRLIDESDDKINQFNTEYKYMKIEIYKTIYYKDGCTKTITNYKDYTAFDDTPLFTWKNITKYYYSKGAIGEDRSYQLQMMIDKNGDSDNE